MENSWPLVGRAEELELLESALSLSGRSGVVLAGPAGVGKTRLAAELAARAEERGWHIVWVSATRSMSGIAFGAVIHLLPDDVGAVEGTAELMRGLRSELRRLGANRQILLCVDDAHLLDDASAAAVHMLAATEAAFILATVRSREPVADAISTLWKDGRAERIELQPLSYQETADALVASLGGQVDALTHHRLWYVTRGNVLFLRELVRAGLANGSLRRHGGVWSWSGGIAFSDRLSELIEERLAGLTTEERAVLEVLAIGEPLAPDFLSRPDLLESLEDRGLIAVGLDRRRTMIRLGHPLYAESLRARIGVLRGRTICGELADRLAATGARRRGDLVRLVAWRLDSGDVPDATTLVAAAREARRVFDHRTVERFAQTAVPGGGVDAHVLLADALYWQGRHEEAAAVLDRVPDGQPRSRALITWQAIVTASNLYWGLGDTEEAEAVLRRAQDSLGDGAEHDELAAHRAYIVVFNGRPQEALTLAETVLTAPSATDMTRFRALNALVLALTFTGRTGRAIEAADLGIQVVRQVADDEPWSASYLQAGQAAAFWFAGRLDDMRRLAESAYTSATNRMADDVRGIWATLLGRALLAQGRVSAARLQLREAAELLRQHDIGSFRAWSLACCAIACAHLGEAEEATTSLAEALSARQPAVRMHDAEIELAKAWVAAARNDHALARTLARAAADEAAARGQRTVEALTLHDMLRLGASAPQARLAELAATVDGDLVKTCAAHAAALAEGDARELRLVADRFATLGAPLHAAEAAAQAATAYRRAGDMPAHLAALSRSRALAAECEGAITPILRASTESPVLATLTAREREIAELAASGLNNREIAARLVLSIRTVGNHLNHVYGKLGVTREDLPAMFGVKSLPRN